MQAQGKLLVQSALSLKDSIKLLQEIDKNK